jgi:hypothetical protein
MNTFWNARHSPIHPYLVFCTVCYLKDQAGLKILPGNQSWTGSHLNVKKTKRQKPKLDRTDDFILFLDRTGPVIK